jgi:4-amino-4-deoxy-L-arabinose transferase-like glycosyltransferase
LGHRPSALAPSRSSPPRIWESHHDPEVRAAPPLDQRRPPATRWSELAVAGIVVLGAVLRFALLGRNSLWFDEAQTVWLTRFSWTEIPALLRQGDAHPPFHFVFMKAWTGLFGTSEASLRWPSAALGVACVVLTYAVARRLFTERVAVLAALLVCVSPLQVMVSQDARMYAMMGALALASTLALETMMRTGGAAPSVLYIAFATLAVYTHYLALLVLLAHGLWACAFERPRVWRWLAAVGIVALLYAPWIPSLGLQAAHGPGRWYHRHESVLDLGDLLGLYAFGGSVFGMGSYFFPGTLGGLTQCLVLLPFMCLLGGAAAVFVRDPSRRRSLGLLGLVLLVPVATLSALSLSGHPLYPRWLAFLSPLCAIGFSVGAVDLAGRAGANRQAALACLTAGLLACGLPVLDRYYTDPTFRAYRWRDAAAVVHRWSTPNDLIIYVNSAAEIAFTYYWRDHLASLTLTPVEETPAATASPAFTAAQARRLAARYPRVWLIATPPFTAAMQQRLQVAFAGAYRVTGQSDFSGIWVHRLDAR